MGLQNKFFSGTEYDSPNVPGEFKRPVAPVFQNVRINFMKKRENYIPSIKRERKTVFSPQPMHKTESDIFLKNSVINRGSVKKASFPNYIGMTPDYDNINMLSTRPSFSNANKSANNRAKLKISSGNFKFEMPRNLDSPGQRKINPLEYRGPNMSDCMYHTM